MKIKTFFLLLFLLLPGLILAEEIVLPEALIRGEDRSKTKTPSIEFVEEKGEEIFLPKPSSPLEKILSSWEVEIGVGENKKSRFLLSNEMKREGKFGLKNSFLFEKYEDNEKRNISLEWERFFPAENGWKGEISYQQSRIKTPAFSSSERNEITSFHLGYYDAPLSFLTSFSQERLENHYQVEDYALSARIDKIQITADFYTYAGLKVEKRKAVGFLFLPEIGISFEPTEKLAIFLDGSSSLDIPRFDQLYLEKNFAEVKEDILKPEQERKIKFGVSKKINKGNLEINFFTGEREDLIIWSDRDGNGLYQPANIKKANFCGGQIILEKQYSPYFRQKFLYTHQEVESKDSSISYIPYYPADIFENTFEIKVGRFVFEIIGKYLGKQYEQENSSEE